MVTCFTQFFPIIFLTKPQDNLNLIVKFKLLYLFLVLKLFTHRKHGAELHMVMYQDDREDLKS